MRIEVMEYRQGKRIADSDGEPVYSDLHHENVMLQAEIERFGKYYFTFLLST